MSNLATRLGVDLPSPECSRDRLQHPSKGMRRSKQRNENLIYYDKEILVFQPLEAAMIPDSFQVSFAIVRQKNEQQASLQKKKGEQGNACWWPQQVSFSVLSSSLQMIVCFDQPQLRTILQYYNNKYDKANEM